MTHKILASEVARIPDFRVKVQQHAADMKHWRGHMARVEADKKNKVPVDQAHAPFGRPMAHPLVDAAVNENGEPDFELVDDGPTPDQVLAAKKNHLLGLVSIAENEANAAVVPRGKVRLYQMRENDIRAAISKASLVDKIKSAVGVEKISPADQKFLDEQEARRARYAGIARIAAQALHDIEDLTLANIDAWKLPDFKS